MVSGRTLAAPALIFALVGCVAKPTKTEIRALPAPLSATARSVPARIAEANTQLALGNVALALESFRKALREQPGSVDSMVGLASCYDRMGRFDLSRRYYESALAIEPANDDLLARFAQSLVAQGQAEQAAAVIDEVRARRSAMARPASAATAPPTEVTAYLPAGAPVPAGAVVSRPGEAVTVTLPPAVLTGSGIARAPAVATSALTVVLPAPSPRGHPRLERMSLGEVALVTTPNSSERAQRLRRSAADRMVQAGPTGASREQFVPLRLLNAARRQGLAANTRVALAGQGWRRIIIGDAPRVRATSLILYPGGQHANAKRLAAQFKVAVARRASVSEITILLGRDVAKSRKRSAG